MDPQPTAPPRAVELQAGALHLALRPDLGGCIAGLWHRGMPVLRSTPPAELSDVRLAGSFPLVPYSNRLGYRRFRWQGEQHETLPNFPEGPHSLHGSVWQRAWRVDETGDSHAVLALSHQPDGHWPYAFDVVQTFDLTPQSLRIALRVANTDARTQPIGLGWHPYIPKREGSRLDIDVAHRWAADPTTLLPVERLPQPGGLHAPVAALDLDNCFEGWRGAARAADPSFAVAFTSSLPYLVVFTPPTKDFYCIEPVSHLNDAIHRDDPLAHGLQAVSPGASVEAWMQIDVAPVR